MMLIVITASSPVVYTSHPSKRDEVPFQWLFMEEKELQKKQKKIRFLLEILKRGTASTGMC